MNPEILAWISKAEEDWRIMCRESTVVEGASLNGVCFHAQQCIEKYFKARLRLAEISIRKTHDLLVLYNEIVLLEPLWPDLHDGLADVSSYAVALRYPGLDATLDEAVRAVEFCGFVRRLVRRSLDLQVDP